MLESMIWAQTRQILHEADCVLLLCHEHADADAINSVASFAMFLAGMGVAFRFGYADNLPETLFLLDDSFKLGEFIETSANAIPADVVVVLDTGDIHLLGDAQSLLTHFQAQHVPVICIDHHLSNKNFGDINIVETSAAAVCELLFDLFRAADVDISPAMAHSLLGGLLGDTHNLTTSHVTAGTLRKAADLMDLGADRTRITEAMPMVASAKTAKAWGQLLDNVQLAGPNEEIAYTVATKKIVASSGQGYIKSISSFLRDVGGIQVAMVFIESDNQGVKIEFRSKSQVDVREIAESLGGGGHRGASGCLLKDVTMEEAIQVTLGAVLRHMV
jgi:phosphoesterase RecJ-like protein